MEGFESKYKFYDKRVPIADDNPAVHFDETKCRTVHYVVELVKQRRPFSIIIPWNAREMCLFVFIAANVPMHVLSAL